jgi:hypothetical protein
VVCGHDCAHWSTCLGDGFGVLGSWNGIEHDSSTRLNVRVSIANKGSANRNGHIGVASEVKVTDYPAKDATVRVFEFIDDL